MSAVCTNFKKSFPTESAVMTLKDWNNPDQELVEFISSQYETTLEVYKSDITRIEEDLKKEISIAEGGYGRKQIQELIQNAADALRGTKGRVEVVLTEDHLYVANQGQPFVKSGVKGLLYTHISDKTDDQIGRFGLGFKSISGISNKPQIFSQSVSFAFGRDQTAEILTGELGRPYEPADVPGLRLAWVLDPSEEFERDNTLRSLATWAVTVIKIPLNSEQAVMELSNEIESFDETFCLFAPQVNRLTFVDKASGNTTYFETKKTGDTIAISANGTTEEKWAVIEREHHPSEAAMESAGQAARRESVTVSWAVPLAGRAGVGQLTAYFPVMSTTTLSGRINAPWKLSDDRMNIIESEFNREILTEVVPSLVVEGRKYLVSTGPEGNKNFGRYLDVLPARGREIRSWADGVINEPIYRQLRAARSLPNANGEWRSPQQVTPIPAVADDFAADWLDMANHKEDWIHPECTSSSERRSKALRLQNKDKDGQQSGLVTKWLEDVLEGDDTNPQRSIAAIKLVENLTEVLKVGSDHVAQATKARVALLEDLTLVAPRPGNCFIRSDADQSGNAFVHENVAEDSAALKSLENLGITRYEDNGDLYEFLRKLRRTLDIDWDTGWRLMRGAPFDDLRRAINEILGPNFVGAFKVRNGHGDWVLPTDLFRPGSVFSPVKEDGRFLIDHVYHAADKAILEHLGVQETPRIGYPVLKEKWAKTYKDMMYKDLSPTIGIPEARRHMLEYKSDDMRLGPLGSLPELSQTNKLNLTRFILNRARPTAQVWYQGKDERRSVISPELWLVKEHGLLETSLGAFPVSESFFLTDASEDVSRILPVVENLDIGRTAIACLESRTDIGQLSVDDFRLLPIVHRRRDDESAVAESYAWWCHQYPDFVPETMLAKFEDEWIERSPEQIAVTSDPARELEMESLGFPSLTVPDPIDAKNLSDYWKMQEAHTIPKRTLFSPAAEPVALGFVFPALEDEDIEDFDSLELQACESLAIESSMPGYPSVQKEMDFFRDGDVLYTVADSAPEKLEHMLRILELDSSKEAVEALLHSSEARKNNEFRTELKMMDSDVERLLRFAGEDRLLSLIPQSAIDYIEQYSGAAPASLKLAQTGIEMYGAAALEKVCKVKNGVDLPIAAPPTWSGSHAARRWVRDLGFDESWAGSKPVRRATPTEYVGGPAQLEPLHGYQQEVSNNLRSMLSPHGLNRGLLNLPTGAGKTRVAVQTIIESIAQGDLDYLTSDEFTGPILWLVDSEELCEQAIESWSYLWRAKGRPNTQLILSRHFDTYAADEETAGVQVVVATYQKTVGSIDKPEYDWLKETPLVIIDEAHGAISASYTKILEWTGRTPGKRDKLLLGLSATPFRGSEDSDETNRLHRRFDENFLAEGVFGDRKPLAWLQQHDVLSTVTMQVIRSGRPTLHLTESEKKEFKEKHWLPKNREQELGQQSGRTRQIIESIKSQPEDWPILVFATSVANAQTLATLLTLEGIPASAIDSNTPDTERRLALERFKSGELRVLTNYAVLSQGFDAPKTRAVYITRPVQSPVRYQQMIGRGLRGPKNGGTENVLIVNLLDNIESFESSISYENFEYLAEDQIVIG